MARRRTNKKAQVWLSDYTLSMLLFILAALISVKIIINSFSANTDFQELKTEASKISEILMSEGYPVDWTNETVIRPGLLTDRRLNQTKVAHAMDHAYLNYTFLKFMLQAKHDFAVVFEHPNGELIQFEGLCVIGNTSVSPICLAPTFNFRHKNMVQLNRLMVYNRSIVKAVVYTWN